MKDLYKYGGRALLRKYNDLLPAMFAAIYPEMEYKPRSATNPREFLDWAAKQLQIKDLNDWYNVTKKDLFQIGETVVEYV